MVPETTPCQVCMLPTMMLGTGLCNSCYEVDRRIHHYSSTEAGRERMVSEIVDHFLHSSDYRGAAAGIFALAMAAIKKLGVLASAVPDIGAHGVDLCYCDNFNFYHAESREPVELKLKGVWQVTSSS